MGVKYTENLIKYEFFWEPSSGWIFCCLFRLPGNRYCLRHKQTMLQHSESIIWPFRAKGYNLKLVSNCVDRMHAASCMHDKACGMKHNSLALQ